MKASRLVCALVFSLVASPFGPTALAAEREGVQAEVHKATGKATEKAPAKTPARKKSEVAKSRLDLSLPPEMVNELEPASKVDAIVLKPLLPSMFDEALKAGESPFQLNGRLISNEMQLQLRNDFQREIEGAALEFEFKR